MSTPRYRSSRKTPSSLDFLKEKTSVLNISLGFIVVLSFTLSIFFTILATKKYTDAEIRDSNFTSLINFFRTTQGKVILALMWILSIGSLTSGSLGMFLREWQKKLL